MSTTPAPRTLFHRWIDDAAVFPPGQAPVPRAWSEHVELRSGPYADLLGPLLIGTGGAAELVEAASVAPPPDHLSPVPVAVVGRAGTTVDAVIRAARSLQASPHLTVTGTEVAHAGGDWRRLVDLGLRTAVELPRGGTELIAALDDLGGGVAQEVGGDDAPVALAKLRTQATPQAPAPDVRELAEFLLATQDRGLAFKLTGGLHRAIAQGPEAREPHGALNILVATHHLLRGTTLPDLQATLEIQDGPALASLVAGLNEQSAQDIRQRFVSFGCCGVLDPLDELAGLGLLASTRTKEKES